MNAAEERGLKIAALADLAVANGETTVERGLKEEAEFRLHALELEVREFRSVR